MDDLIIKSILDAEDKGVKATLATIIRTEGSTPREPGTRMLIREDKQINGTIGGGNAEKFIMDRALSLLQENIRFEAEVHHLDSHSNFHNNGSAACGGKLDILLETVLESDFWRYAWNVVRNKKKALSIISLFPPYTKSIRDFQGNILWGRSTTEPAITAPLLKQLSGQQQAFIWEANGFSWLVEEISPRERLLILGGGHVGRGVSYYAKPLDFQVTVIDEREAFARKELFLGAQDVLCAGFVEGINNYIPNRDTYVVIATWSHQTDEQCLKEILNYPAKYIGLLGSKKKIANILSNLKEEGYTADNFARVNGPIGLDIGAQTPEEIALSTVAEIIATRRKGNLL